LTWVWYLRTEKYTARKVLIYTADNRTVKIIAFRSIFFLSLKYELYILHSTLPVVLYKVWHMASDFLVFGEWKVLHTYWPRRVQRHLLSVQWQAELISLCSPFLFRAVPSKSLKFCDYSHYGTLVLIKLYFFIYILKPNSPKIP
jgi:hypothetical protein